MQADFQKLVDALTEYFQSHRRFMEGVVNILGPMDAPDGEKGVDKWIKFINTVGVTAGATSDLAKIVPDHARRLRALEERHRGDRIKQKPQRRLRQPKGK